MKRIHLIILVFVMCFIGVTASFGNISTIPQTAAETPAQPTERKANFQYSNRTILPYPIVDSSSQRSAPFNTSIFQEMISLTTVTPEVWRSFTLSDSDVFLAVDGASQSRVLRVLIEVYSPSSLVKAENTTAKDHLHVLTPSPSVGMWQLHLKLLDTGNTTAWVQAITYNDGAKLVVDYHKERIHLYAGQTLYFRMQIEAKDWLSIYCVRLAGATTKYELYRPLEYDLAWKKKTNTFDDIYSEQNLPSTGEYLLVITNEGDVDLMVQLTLPDGVSDTLTANESFVMKFALEHENEHLYVDVNSAFSWIALAGSVTNSSAWTRYILIDPDMTRLTDATSNRIDGFISRILAEPIQGKYLLLLRGSANTQATVQLKTSGSEDGTVAASLDEKISFTQSGQTIWYKVPTNSGERFLYLATSLSSAKSQHRIFDFRATQIWSGYSTSQSQPKYTAVTSVGGDYLVQIQGKINSDVMIHLRFDEDEDYSLTTPDYTDFTLRFAGDVIMSKVMIRNSRYFNQYWHALGDNFAAFVVYNTNLGHMGSNSFYRSSDQSRYTWTVNDPTFAAGIWFIIVTGSENGAIRVTQLQTGDEERMVQTPFQIFETFDFDYKAEAFLVNIPECLWFSVVAQSQTDSEAHLRVLDPELVHRWDVSRVYKEKPSHRNWQSPKSGSWLMIYNGLQSTNVSMTFLASDDPMSNILEREYYTEEFSYYGETRCRKTYVSDVSYLGLDAMLLIDKRTDIYLIDPEGGVEYSTYSDTKYDVEHELSYNPENGTWYVILIGIKWSKIVYRMTSSADQQWELPFVEDVSSDFDGKVTYISFGLNTLDQLQINFTSKSDADTWLWLYDTDGRLRYQRRFQSRDDLISRVFSDPSDGDWLVVLVQEVFASLRISSGGRKALPTGIFVEFVYPVDATIVLLDDGNTTVLPIVTGIINVAVNVTDNYHVVTTTRLYSNGGDDHTEMEYNSISRLYEVSFNTTVFEDGLYELVAFAQCQVGEIGIASISIHINNYGTPPIEDANPPIVGAPYQEPEAHDVKAEQGVNVFVDVSDAETGVHLVILSCSADQGETWDNSTMIRQNMNMFKGYIPGFAARTNVTYMILAYDYVGNCAVEDNNGDCYGYSVSSNSIVVSITASSNAVKSEDSVLVGVHVTDGTFVIQDALVQLETDRGGIFIAQSGYTDSNGDFATTFAAPSVSEQTDLRITATASKSGYVDGSSNRYLVVLPQDAVSLSVIITADPTSVQPEQASVITVHVTDGTSQTLEASVVLSSDDGGTLSPASGYTNSSGYFSSTFTAPSVPRETIIALTAVANKTGYLDGQGQVQITVATTILSVSVTASPSTVQSGEISTVTTRVTHDGNPVSGAIVTLSSNKGGTFTQSSDSTNSNGYFVTAFAAPIANTQATVTITAEATKTGYLDGQDQTYITVSSIQPPPAESSTALRVYLAIIVVILSVIGFGIALARRKGTPSKKQAVFPMTS